MKFRKRPVVIDAERFTGESRQADRLGLEYRALRGSMTSDGFYVSTLEGAMRADVGDWIITGVKGERYPCKHEIFELTYEPVRELLPCPFCGFHEWLTPVAHMARDSRCQWIVCPKCTTCGSPKETESAAVAAWNERTP